MELFRIHGDNIVECERITNIIISALEHPIIQTHLLTPSTPIVTIQAAFEQCAIEWKLELLPGFNKNTKIRWERNIFEPLCDAGSYLDETPDAIVTHIDLDGHERILLGIEFCSALQAGNQAWQRSGRAFSTGRTGCPYLYIVDFVKYELQKQTRTRKILRFPNAAVPFSYISYSRSTGNFIAQLYVKSEEFDRTKDPAIADFDEDDFGRDDLGRYIVKLMCGLDTSLEETTILQKNMNVVEFLARRPNNKADSNFTAEEWKALYETPESDVVEQSLSTRRFIFHKSIASKSHHGASADFVSLVDELSVGLASKDLPFGIIPRQDRIKFTNQFMRLYPSTAPEILTKMARTDKHLIVSIYKGFKPKGDDNRPDRGLLPFVSMLYPLDVDVLSFIYGPLLDTSLRLLDNNQKTLARKNGLWRAILALSDFVVIDAPVLGGSTTDATRVFYTAETKREYAEKGADQEIAPRHAFSPYPINIGEDDVDTGIHYFFAHLLYQHCFEGMCNPPGGDWSGFSVIDGQYENRWLSLPRVSDTINGKRPDHILELFGVFDRPLLLSIESKERSAALEPDVGNKLVEYIRSLMGFIPSAKRKLYPETGSWQWGDTFVNFTAYETISAAAYLKQYAEPSHIVFQKKCELLFVMEPIVRNNNAGWEIEIIPSSNRSRRVKEFIVAKYAATGDTQYVIK